MTVEPKTTIFDALNQEETSNQIAQHLPDGKAWTSKIVPDSNVRGVIESCAAEFNIVQSKIEQLAREYDVNLTVDLLPDWEKMAGIPDECIDTLGSLEERRALVISRLQKIPVVTLEEFQALVDSTFPNDSIVLVPGAEFFTYEYNYEYVYLGDINEKFILVARVPFANEYEYDYEYEYTGGPDTDKLRCIIEKILPANAYLYIDFFSDS